MFFIFFKIIILNCKTTKNKIFEKYCMVLSQVFYIINNKTKKVLFGSCTFLYVEMFRQCCQQKNYHQNALA